MEGSSIPAGQQQPGKLHQYGIGNNGRRGLEGDGMPPTAGAHPAVSTPAGNRGGAGLGSLRSEDKEFGVEAKALTHGGNSPADLEGGSINSKDESLDAIERQKLAEQNHDIKFRSCSWQKTAALLFSEYICLAIMSFPWSYSILGLIPGLIITVVVAASVLYTSRVLWRYCLAHPEVQDVCDIGQKLFWGMRWAWYATAVCFLLNNTFIMALHCLVGAKYLNTMSSHGACTVVFSIVIALASFLLSLPRTFSALSKAATFSAVTMFLAVVLSLGFAGKQDHPFGYDPVAIGEPTWTLWPKKGTSFVSGMSAFLNISYTFIGQITIPSFIAEMENPRDFPKALYSVTAAEIIVFSLAGAIIYVYTGNEYMTAPAFGSIGYAGTIGKKIAFSFALPTIIFLGILYAAVSARFLMNRIFRNSELKHSNSLKANAAWAGILFVLWVAAWIISEVIPFFSDLLSIMSSLFDSFFGFIFWGVAWLRLRQEKDLKRGGTGKATAHLTLVTWIEFVLNWFLIVVGFFFLTAGTYASVQSVIDNFRAGAYGGVFSCADNSL